MSVDAPSNLHLLPASRTACHECAHPPCPAVRSHAQTTVNASSMASRFRSLPGLKLILTEALDGIERSRAKAMDKLQVCSGHGKDP